MKDIDAIRRENLRLIEKEAGGPTEAAKLCEMAPSQFTNLRDGAKDSKTGKPRGMRKETARRIEAGAGKPPGWLDINHSFNNSDSTSDAGSKPPSLPEALKTVATAFAAAPAEKRRALLEVLAAYAANPQAEGGSLAYLQGELAKAAPEAESQSQPSAKQVQPAVETRAFAGKPPSTEQNINPHKTGVFSRK